MPLNKIQFKSGIISDVTPYTNEGGFVDGDKIRFRLGSPEKIGGWVKYSTNTYLGTARRLHNWIALDGSDFLGVGTHLKYYIEEGQTFNDITPIRETTSAGDVTDRFPVISILPVPVISLLLRSKLPPSCGEVSPTMLVLTPINSTISLPLRI